MSVEALKKVWPEWDIEGKPLGKGSYGVVYKGVRRDHNVESYAAIKLISIPADPAEAESLRAEGMDASSTRKYYQGIVNDFVGEIQLMESLKGVQNIVSVEDYRVVEKQGEIGWDIYIRMELLTPFNAYINGRKMSEQQVIKLGVDICSALEICARKNIIHRDIKPENIFVNEFGYFKLGDFGIARKMDNMSGGLSQKGTFNYMAPEVTRTTNYDARVDIYSLGVVLYRLLNGNRLPFLDNEQQLMDPNARREATGRRLRGDKLPRPCDASPAMADVILRACEYDPNKRYLSATAMKQALISVANGTHTVPADDLDKTTAVRRAPGSQNQAAATQNGYGNAAPRVGQFGRGSAGQIYSQATGHGTAGQTNGQAAGYGTSGQTYGQGSSYGNGTQAFNQQNAYGDASGVYGQGAGSVAASSAYGQGIGNGTVYPADGQGTGYGNTAQAQEQKADDGKSASSRKKFGAKDMAKKVGSFGDSSKPKASRRKLIMSAIAIVVLVCVVGVGASKLFGGSAEEIYLFDGDAYQPDNVLAYVINCDEDKIYNPDNRPLEELQMVSGGTSYDIGMQILPDPSAACKLNYNLANLDGNYTTLTGKIAFDDVYAEKYEMPAEYEYTIYFYSVDGDGEEELINQYTITKGDPVKDISIRVKGCDYLRIYLVRAEDNTSDYSYPVINLIEFMLK